MKLSSSMICWNEAQTIDLALKSIVSLVDEVIIVDTGSFDGTPKIARETMDKLNLSGQVKEIAVTKLVDARLEAFLLCDGDWVLMQDSNVVLSDALKREILEHMKNNSPVVGAIKSLNLMGDYTHLFRNRPFMAYHRILTRGESITRGTRVDRPIFRGSTKNLFNWAANLSRVRPAWRYWLRGEQFDRRCYDNAARKRGDGHQNKYNIQHLWQKENIYYSPLEYVETTRGLTLEDVKRIAPKWFLRQLRLEARPLIPAYISQLPEVIREELKAPRYKLVYEDNEIVDRWPAL